MRRSIPLVLAAAALLVASSGAYATFPGDSGLILFLAETEDGNQLFTMEPDGTEMRQITHVEPEPGPELPGASRADWSPDGRTIVFNENDCTIAFIDADGGDLRRVPPEPGASAWYEHLRGRPILHPGRTVDRLRALRWDDLRALDAATSTGPAGPWSPTPAAPCPERLPDGHAARLEGLHRADGGEPGRDRRQAGDAHRSTSRTSTTGRPTAASSPSATARMTARPTPSTSRRWRPTARACAT